MSQRSTASPTRSPSTSHRRTRQQGATRSGRQAPVPDTGVAAAAAARKLSAFDTLGTSAGRFTLVALLTGGEQGYYSIDANATSQFPPVPQP